MTNVTASMDPVSKLVSEAPKRIASVSSLDELEALEAELVGRKSTIAELRRGLGSLPAEERPRVGQELKAAADAVGELLSARRAELERIAEDQLLADDQRDVTLPAYQFASGLQHLITQTIDEVTDIFVGLGYRVAAGPEVDTAWYNFDALNTPPTHPSRLETDTLYVEYGDPQDEVLLRAHTSTVQARYMEANQPPVYIVAPGRTFRSDTLDATHSPVFHQIEGLAVDEGITFVDLKGTLAHFAREFFGPGQRIRLNPHFFPFTEPSAEMHVSCFACDGSGCGVCGNSGWIELMGCGMVDPNVFTAVGYDPEAVTGFAFGMGPERLAMARHGINHIRHLYENDVRVLRQFV